MGDTFQNKIWTEYCGQAGSGDPDPWIGHEDEALMASHNVSVAFSVGASKTTSKSKPTKPPVPKKNVMQRDASEDLALVSWPAGKFLPRGFESWKIPFRGYIYDTFEGIVGKRSAISDTYIYVIGEGINLDHRVGHLFVIS